MGMKIPILIGIMLVAVVSGCVTPEGQIAGLESQSELEETQSCSPAYLNEKRCSDNQVQQKYQYENCSIAWIKAEYCDYGCENGKCNPEPQATEMTVSYVLDGDTIQLSDGERVRLAGINTPEAGEKCYEEAKNALEGLLLGKNVRLEPDVEDKDRYGRLLRYVYIDMGGQELFVNSWLVSNGYAISYPVEPDTKYQDGLNHNEEIAKINKEGCLWKSSEENYIQDQCVYITNFNFNAAGNDNYNLNDEYATFGNKCSYSIDMTGWTIKDKTASHSYTFLAFTFQPGARFTLYTGTGINTDSALYWGRTPGDYAAIWNNNGDTLYLRDFDGDLVLTESYSGY